MRNEFVAAFMRYCAYDERTLFLTGDLGYNALEPIQRIMKSRFINVGICEQNMISMAAGMAAEGYKVWVYSIAPFVTLRVAEQIRNDLVFHSSRVVIVGNGGGFTYGAQGHTHHAIEDLAIAGASGVRAIVPGFKSEVQHVVEFLHTTLTFPHYLRLGAGVSSDSKTQAQVPPGWRQLTDGDRVVVLTMGPIVHEVMQVLPKLSPGSVDLYSCNLFRSPLPLALIQNIISSQKLLIVEEHQSHGGFSEFVLAQLATLGAKVQVIRLAASHVVGGSGSRNWLLDQSGLSQQNILSSIQELLRREPC